MYTVYMYMLALVAVKFRVAISTKFDHGLMCTWSLCALQTLDKCHVVSCGDKYTQSQINMLVYIIVQDGMTALYIASQEGHGPVVELLLQTEHTDISICKKVSPYILVLYLPPVLLS